MTEDEYIEQLRSRLVKMAIEKGSFLDEHVLALSQQLDLYLLRYWKLQQKHNKT